MKKPNVRLRHVLGMLLLSAILLETGSWVLLKLVAGQSASEVRQRLLRRTPPTETAELGGWDSAPVWLADKVLHPFIGFVGNPAHSSPLSRYMNDYGFLGDPAPAAGAEDQVVVAITGGSVAMNLFIFVHSDGHFLDTLRSQPEFAGKDVRVVSLAIDGMKQPQQLMALSYLLSLGRKIDYVVNLDGFNEVVLPWVELVPHGVHPSYPRAWYWHAARTLTSDQSVLLAQIARDRARADGWRRLAATQLRYSSFCLAAWHWLDRRSAAREAALQGKLMASYGLPGAADLPQYGPPYSADSMEEALSESVSVWQQSSLQMWRLCEANGIGYLHALQPNQYLSGSKRLSEEERRRAIGPPEHAYRPPAEGGFPLLREAGRGLASAGVPFVDLTGLFETVPETVYIDDCCHMNNLGNRLMGERLAVRLAGLAASRGSVPRNQAPSPPLATR